MALRNTTATLPLSMLLECFLSMAGDSTPLISIVQKPFLFALSTLDCRERIPRIAAELTMSIVTDNPSMSSGDVAVVLSEATTLFALFIEFGGGETEGDTLADGDIEDEGDTLADGLTLGESLEDGETEADGDMLELLEADGLIDGDSEADGDTEGDSLADGEIEGLSLAEGLTEADGDIEGLSLAEGEILGLSEADGLIDADGDIEGLSDDDGLIEGLSDAEGDTLAGVCGEGGSVHG